MLKSQAWRRRAQKTFAVGSMGSLVVFAGSAFIMATPGVASADVTKTFAYTCSGGPFSNTSLTVTLSGPDSVTAGQTFDVKVNVPTLNVQNPPDAAAPLQVTLDLAPTGGTVSDSGAKQGSQVPTNGSVPASNVAYKIAVSSGTTGKVSVKPGALRLAIGTATSATTCNPSSTTDVLDVPIGTGNGNGTDIIDYDCQLANNATANGYPADAKIRVTLTMPTNAKANADASITWASAFQSTSDQLEIPTGFPTTSPKIYANIKASGAGAPATARGEAALTNVQAGQNLTTLPNVTVKIKPTSTGTVTVTPGDLAFGTSATSPAIKCTAPTSGLKTYTFTVANGTASPSPSPSPTPSNTSPRPTTTHTRTLTITPTPKTTPTRKSQTPKAGADTGAGGTMGPDGRLFILTGTAMIGAAAVGGLLMRRRSIRG
ncbi:hypothetical protein [Nonomuraea sp. B1E8]|uniref:hypothetical protein n=1 Tax=unclassified Nonomuraea TaxID=2593643 RepID=UPI00325D56E1